MSELVEHPLNEVWREYDFDGRIYRIEAPVTLIYREGGSTHRVVDTEGVVHLLPGPGYRGCVIRWLSDDATKPVHF